MGVQVIFYMSMGMIFEFLSKYDGHFHQKEYRKNINLTDANNLLCF